MSGRLLGHLEECSVASWDVGLWVLRWRYTPPLEWLRRAVRLNQSAVRGHIVAFSGRREAPDFYDFAWDSQPRSSMFGLRFHPDSVIERLLN